MEPDFSGWATKAGLKCNDGRTIMPDAFKHQDKEQVPLVWQHGHSDPENVLGHAIMENREEGVWVDCFFNGTAKAAHAKAAVEHKDINSLSIWANELVERSKRVFHGAIREVSLVLSGANPGALIQNVAIHHSDGDEDTVLDDEVIIYTGLEFELAHADTGKGKGKDTGNSASDGEETIQDVYDSMSDKQKNVLHFMLGEALGSKGTSGKAMAQSGLVLDKELDLGDDPDVQAVYESLNDDQKGLLHDMLSEAKSKTHTAKNGKDETLDDKSNDEKGKEMKHNIFEDDKTKDSGSSKERMVLSHSDIELIVAEAKKPGNTFGGAVQEYALAHGITDIDVLFPDAKAITDSPDFISRRTEWVAKVMAGVRKSPFSRIKTLTADITVQEARAKGYIKGTLKKEEFFAVAKRITTPTTIYKKQKLDRDDIVDITDFDVVAWLKGEMRLMLDEEVARAILLGDGRAVDDEDKINEGNIRPIATDNEVYTTTLNVAIDDTPATIGAMIDEIALHRSDLRGSGNPTLFTTETYIARMLLLKDNTGRKLYRNIDELATDMRVSEIVAVEVMEEYDDIAAVLVNLTDYVVGADRGGNVSMFDDFDIDYNQYKYLIETRMSGALVKFKAAMVVRVVAAGAALVVPAAPAFDGTDVTIVDQAGVVYRNAETDVVMNAAGSPYAVAPGDTLNVHAEPAAGSYFRDSDDDDWSFNNPA